MTPKKQKPDAIDVNIESADEAVQKQYADTARATAWKERVWTAAVLALIASAQVVALAWVDSRSSDRVKKVDDKVDVVVGAVEEVHTATNSLTAKLVEATEKEALQRGKDDERKRSDSVDAEVAKDRTLDEPNKKK